jgi:hypothetical protein
MGLGVAARLLAAVVAAAAPLAPTPTLSESALGTSGACGPPAREVSHTLLKTDDDSSSRHSSSRRRSGPPMHRAGAWFRVDFDTLKDPAWPSQWLNYSLLVCTPRFSEAQLRQIKRDVPGAKLLAYFDTQFAMIDKGCASSGNSEYYQAVNRYFKPEWAITDLRTGLPVCLQPHKGWAETRPAGFVVTPQSADAMARYHREVTFGNASSWDGLYLDDSQTVYNEVFAQIITAQTSLFDIDGDGKADNVSDINAQYMAYRPYFFAKLRCAFFTFRFLFFWGWCVGFMFLCKNDGLPRQALDVDQRNKLREKNRVSAGKQPAHSVS